MHIPVQRTPTGRIEDLLRQARDFNEKSNAAERKANARKNAIREMLKLEHEQRARAGNTMSQKLLRYPKQFEVIVDTVTSNDPTWKGAVDDQQFYERKANRAAAQAVLEMNAQGGTQ